ncbi:MAG: phosphate acetyltransferase [Rubricoccaceae bacterium]
MIDALHARARALRKTIVLPEGEDPRTITAACTLAAQQLVRPVLLGRPEAVRAGAETLGLVLPPAVPVHDPVTSERRQAYAQRLFARRKHRGLTYEAALEQAADVLYFGALMVAEGDADGSVAGAAHPTPDVVRAAIQVLGVAEGSALVSSFFLMVLPDGRAVTFADCGVMPAPDPAQLASIGLDAARNHEALTGETPRVAFLSFSTHGSAEHPNVEHVREAVRRAREQAPALALDGELQFDAAFVPEVGRRKAPDSPVAGQANVFVFPDLDAGNIGYKIAQWIGGAEAYGPVLQGLALPANDLSRGAVAEDIVNVAVITAIQAAARAPR